MEIGTLVAAFTSPLELPALDGLVAANSLHFVPRDRQVDVIRAGHAPAAGGTETRRLGRVPSRFLGAIYSAVALRS